MERVGGKREAYGPSNFSNPCTSQDKLQLERFFMRGTFISNCNMDTYVMNKILYPDYYFTINQITFEPMLRKLLRMSEANEVIIISHIWATSTTFKPL